MEKYYITIDDKVVETAYSYREACEIVDELNNNPVNYWKTVRIRFVEN